jgi:hypothetical protein
VLLAAVAAAVVQAWAGSAGLGEAVGIEANHLTPHCSVVVDQ